MVASCLTRQQGADGDALQFVVQFTSTGDKKQVAASGDHPRADEAERRVEDGLEQQIDSAAVSYRRGREQPQQRLAQHALLTPFSTSPAPVRAVCSAQRLTLDPITSPIKHNSARRAESSILPSKSGEIRGNYMQQGSNTRRRAEPKSQECIVPM
ncbi:uncharacterized protein LOC124701130 [Lolium rigidum]|uniref:uncharacterized protein LOC124701130 n=1 Tax=Lolium rigidum TaxID=89674 RepID=UPI001F5C169E|nr:uncharacterized protein LOC124701130 [Lolium rigidum]